MVNFFGLNLTLNRNLLNLSNHSKTKQANQKQMDIKARSLSHDLKGTSTHAWTVVNYWLIWSVLVWCCTLDDFVVGVGSCLCCFKESANSKQSSCGDNDFRWPSLLTQHLSVFISSMMMMISDSPLFSY